MKNIVVLVSGGGTNLQRIIDCTATGEIPNAQVTLVVADRECFGLQRAANHGIPNMLIKRGQDFSVNLARVLPQGTDLIVLAGFLSILDSEFCGSFSGKIINIHPALLPKFGGKGMWGHHVHEAVLEAGEKESGATVHFVTPGIDEGKIVLQKSFKIAPDETPESLAEKVYQIEYSIFPQAIKMVLRDSESK
jgi:phosphoribosylglycinamide formyltransferase-1